MGGQDTKFKKGNKAAEKWNFIKSARKLIAFREFVYENEFKSIQRACIEFRILPSMYQYLADKYPVFERIKKDIASYILAHINDKALEGERNGGYSATASIWRMKQLGEKDERDINQKVTNIEPPKIEFDE